MLIFFSLRDLFTDVKVEMDIHIHISIRIYILLNKRLCLMRYCDKGLALGATNVSLNHWLLIPQALIMKIESCPLVPYRSDHKFMPIPKILVEEILVLFLQR